MEEQGEFKIKRKTVLCPHCNEAISIPFKVDIGEVQRANFNPRHWRDALTDEQRSLLERAESAGLFTAMEAAVMEGISAEARPADIGKFLLNWMRVAVPKRIAGFALEYFINEFPNTRIDVWAAQGIMAIVADGTIRAFVPQKLAMGQAIRGSTSSGGTRARMPADQAAFQNWVKTRFGYVERGSLLLDELRRKSVGDFARPNL